MQEIPEQMKKFMLKRNLHTFKPQKHGQKINE